MRPICHVRAADTLCRRYEVSSSFSSPLFFVHPGGSLPYNSHTQMLSLILIFICTLLAKCAPHTNVQVASDNSQVGFSVMDLSRPAEPPDPLQNGTGAATPSSYPLVMAYYPDWVDIRPEDVPFHLFDWIDFAFALPTNSMGLTWDNPDSAPEKLHQLVSRAHSCGTKVKLSVGGWTGSKYFSSAVRTQKARDLFANSIYDVYNEFNLDGIDLDWEYPGRGGADGNEIDPDDSSNFLLFLQKLRSVLPADTCITAAVQTVPFMDAQGEPMKDLKPFAALLNWTMLMNYDVWTSSPFPGPNAPMYDGCQNSTQPESNAVAGVQKWTSAGFSSAQLVLGVPSYGYLSSSSAQGLRQRRRARPNRLRNGAPADVKLVGEDGQIMFRELVKQGALVRIPPTDNTSYSTFATFVGAGGFTRSWDGCSGTPYLHSDSAQQTISYDDNESLRMKAEFAKGTGMGGVNMFNADGDTEQRDLIEAIRQGLFACNSNKLVNSRSCQQS
ncbi:Chitinase A1 [Termitomyces sp. T112]|nr:Chitinase A1 [Termitomyces sp. T112]